MIKIDDVRTMIDSAQIDERIFAVSYVYQLDGRSCNIISFVSWDGEYTEEEARDEFKAALPKAILYRVAIDELKPDFLEKRGYMHVSKIEENLKIVKDAAEQFQRDSAQILEEYHQARMKGAVL